LEGQWHIAKNFAANKQIHKTCSDGFMGPCSIVSVVSFLPRCM